MLRLHDILIIFVNFAKDREIVALGAQVKVVGEAGTRILLCAFRFPPRRLWLTSVFMPLMPPMYQRRTEEGRWAYTTQARAILDRERSRNTGLNCRAISISCRHLLRTDFGISENDSYTHPKSFGA